METNKEKKAVNGLPFYALTFLVALLFELYWILNGPSDYFMLIGIGIIIVITGYLTIDSILKMRNDELAARQQQNDTLVKAQKAIYLATKKNAMHTEKICEQNMKTMEVLMAGMVSSQKELLGVISAKSNELSSSPIAAGNSSDIGELVDKLSKSNEDLAKHVQDAMTINDLVKSNAELVKNVQNMFNGTTETNITATETPSNDSVSQEDIVELPEAIDESFDTTFDTTFDETFDETGLDDSLVVDTLTETAEELLANTDLSLENTDSTTEDAQPLEDMPGAEEEIASEAHEEMSTTTENDERDPNAPLSEEEIAALFASL